MFNSLLPPNASLLERAFDKVFDRILQIPVNIRSVWRPEDCPKELLPWLAWAMSVDTWEEEWETNDVFDQLKRDVISESVQTQRHKGTAATIQQVFDTLGVTVDLTEWWEPLIEDPPSIPSAVHTFDVKLFVNNNFVPGSAETLLSGDLYQSITNTLDAIKPVRSYYTFTVGFAFNNKIGFAGNLQAAKFLRRPMPIKLEMQLNWYNQIGYSSVVQAGQLLDRSMPIKLQLHFNWFAQMGWSSVLQAAQFLRRRFFISV